MKTNCWLVLGAMLASSAIAQNNTNALPEMPAPITTPAAETSPAPATVAQPVTKPAPKPVKHRAKARVEHPRPALHEPTITLVPGPAEVAVSNLIVRGQAGLKGEVVAHLFKGDTVTVLDQINLDRHAPGEPAQWAKITYPAPHVWVFGKYIDPTTKEVTARKLNLRAGPGENFSVVGVLEKGASVNEVGAKGEWLKIGAPSNAYAFVAAMYLKQAPAPVVAAAPPPPETETTPAPAPVPTPVPETQPVAAAPATPPPVAAPAPVPVPATMETETPPGPRIASREGVVRHVGSLITPTAYELYDPATDKNIDFLYTTSTNLDFGRYVGMRIIVSGEEGLAKRWHDIPVLTVESIQVVDSNAVPPKVYYSPRQQGLHHR